MVYKREKMLYQKYSSTSDFTFVKEFFSLHNKTWFRDCKRTVIIYLPLPQNQTWFPKRWCPQPSRKPSEEVRWSGWSHKLLLRPVAIFPDNLSGLFNKPILWMRSEMYRKRGNYFHLLLMWENFQSRRAVSLKFSLKSPMEDVRTFEHLYSNHQSSVWVSDFWSFWEASPGAWGVRWREPQSDRRLKGSHTRKICLVVRSTLRI